jgi:hypothetical protein
MKGIISFQSEYSARQCAERFSKQTGLIALEKNQRSGFS